MNVLNVRCLFNVSNIHTKRLGSNGIDLGLSFNNSADALLDFHKCSPNGYLQRHCQSKN